MNKSQNLHSSRISSWNVNSTSFKMPENSRWKIWRAKRLCRLLSAVKVSLNFSIFAALLMVISASTTISAIHNCNLKKICSEFPFEIPSQMVQKITRKTVTVFGLLKIFLLFFYMHCVLMLRMIFSYSPTSRAVHNTHIPQSADWVCIWSCFCLWWGLCPLSDER